LFRLTAAPIGAIELVHKGLVDTVDHSVESEHGMLVDLSEQHFVIVRAIGGDRLTGGRAPHEVDTLALELEFFTIGNKEFLAAVGWLYALSLVVELVGLLVVNKDVGTAGTFEPGFEDWLMSNIREKLLKNTLH